MHLKCLYVNDCAKSVLEFTIAVGKVKCAIRCVLIVAIFANIKLLLGDFISGHNFFD